MKVGLIYQKFTGYNASRLTKEIKKKSTLVKMNPKDIFLTMNSNLGCMLTKKKLDVNVIIPRMGSSTLQFGLMALKHLNKWAFPALIRIEQSCIVKISI